MSELPESAHEGGAEAQRKKFISDVLARLDKKELERGDQKGTFSYRSIDITAEQFVEQMRRHDIPETSQEIELGRSTYLLRTKDERMFGFRPNAARDNALYFEKKENANNTRLAQALDILTGRKLYKKQDGTTEWRIGASFDTLKAKLPPGALMNERMREYDGSMRIDTDGKVSGGKLIPQPKPSETLDVVTKDGIEVKVLMFKDGKGNVKDIKLSITHSGNPNNVTRILGKRPGGARPEASNVTEKRRKYRKLARDAAEQAAKDNLEAMSQNPRLLEIGYNAIVPFVLRSNDFSRDVRELRAAGVDADNDADLIKWLKENRGLQISPFTERDLLQMLMRGEIIVKRTNTVRGPGTCLAIKGHDGEDKLISIRIFEDAPLKSFFPYAGNHSRHIVVYMDV